MKQTKMTYLKSYNTLELSADSVTSAGIYNIFFPRMAARFSRKQP